MAKLGSGMAEKLKNMARNLKDEEDSKGSVKKISDKIKSQTSGHKKDTDGGKVSGRKN